MSISPLSEDSSHVASNLSGTSRGGDQGNVKANLLLTEPGFRASRTFAAGSRLRFLLKRVHQVEMAMLPDLLCRER